MSVGLSRASGPDVASEPSRYRRNTHRYGAHEIILRGVPAGSTVLDVGCATGYLGMALQARGCRCWGLDREAAAVAVAEPWYEEVRAIDLDDCAELPWPEQFFDVVVAADVLEHLRDPNGALRLLRQRIRPGGRLIVSLPNVAHASVRLPLLIGRFEYGRTGILDETHVHLYTFRTARELVESGGFTVERLLGASDHFGALLQWHRVSRPVRGLLAHNIVALATLGP
jgi:2-polyprenyl-3-methyl-5-hydroxy-6-metoxy-1,4-benzoquinol methylase